MADEIVLVDVVYDTSEAEKNIDDLTESIEGLTVEQAKLKDQLAKGAISQKEFSKQSAKIANQLADEKKERKDNIKLIRSEENSRDKLRLTVSKLIKDRNKLNTSTEEGAKKSEELRVRINKLNEGLKDTGTETEKNKMSIGGYKDAIKEAAGELGLFGGVLQPVTTFQEKFNNLVSLSGRSFKAVSTSTKGASKSLRFFKIALISTGIGVIIVALGALVVMFTKTQSGLDKVSKLFNQFSAVVDAIFGRIIRLGEAFGKLVSGDVRGAIQSTVSAFSGLGDEIKRTVDEAGRIADLKVELRKLNIETTTALSNLSKISDLNKAIADDATRSFKEREEAAEKARIADEKAAIVREENGRRQLEIVTRENNLIREQGQLTDEQAQAQADAGAAFIDIQKESQLIFLENEKQRRELIQDRLERDLDILIDGFDNTKTINDKIIADDKRTIDERLRAFKLLEVEGKNSFDKQIETIKEFTNVAFSENELLKESNAVLLNEKIRGLGLSEIIEGRLLEIIRERRIVEAEQAENEKILIESRKQDLQSLKDLSERLEQEKLASNQEFLDQEINQLHESNNVKAEITAEAQQRELQADAETQAKKMANLQMALGAAQELTGAFFAFQNASREADFRKEIEAAGGNEEAKAKIEKKFGKRRKKDAIKQALINTALAVGNALATTIPFIPNGLIAGGIAAVKGGLEVATINKQSFGMGGQIQIAKNGMKLGTFSGASHGGGGIDLYTGSGQHVANVEGKENFYVINKNASDYINSLSDINQRIGGGVPLTKKSSHMQDGGQANLNTNNERDINTLTEQVVNNLPPIVVNVGDIKTGLDTREEVVDVGVV